MNYLKGSLRVMADYCISLLIFSFFIITFFNHRIIYSFIIFLLFVFLLHSDIKRLAIKEKRPQYNLKPHPFKGLILGFIGFSPFIALVLVYPLITFNNSFYDNLKRVILNVLLGPLYFFVKLGGSTYTMYLAAMLIVPVATMISYLAGYYGFDLRALIKKLHKSTAAKK